MVLVDYTKHARIHELFSINFKPSGHVPCHLPGIFNFVAKTEKEN